MSLGLKGHHTYFHTKEKNIYDRFASHTILVTGLVRSQLKSLLSGASSENKQAKWLLGASLSPSTRPCLPLNPSIGEPKKEYPIFQPLKGVGFFLS
jgi:hypothetical protein